MSKLINVLHILIFAPLLILFSQKPSWNNWLMQLLFAILAVGVLFHHGRKAVATGWWVSWFHALIVAPVLALLAWRGSALSKSEGDIVLVLGLGAIAFHGWRLVSKL